MLLAGVLASELIDTNEKMEEKGMKSPSPDANPYQDL